MNIKGAIDKLKSGGGEWDYIAQADGSRFYYKPKKDPHRSFFLYAMDCLEKDVVKEPRRPVPPLIKAVASAADRDGAMRKMFPEYPARPPMCAFKIDKLIDEGVIEEDFYAWGVADEWGDEEDEG